MEFWDHLFLFKRLYDQAMEPIAQRWDLTRMELDISYSSWPMRRPMILPPTLWSGGGLPNPMCLFPFTPWSAGGWLERSYLPGNRKRAHLRLLPASAPAVADGQAAQAALRAQLSQGMTAAERAALESAVTRIGENLRLALKGDA